MQRRRLSKIAPQAARQIEEFGVSMKSRFLITSILSATLTFSASASPIHFSHIVDTQSGRAPNGGNTNSQRSTTTPEQATSSLTVESLDHPEFVRLADGRLVPYGPGVNCSDACVESEVIPAGFPRKWLIALPIGAAVIGVLLATDSTRVPRRAVDSTTQPPVSPTPTPTPNTSPTPHPSPTPTPPVCQGGNCNNPPTEPVPEPGTIALLGVGLALMGRRRVREMLRRKQK